MINTVKENQRNSLDHFEDLWLFGYGSLIFKVDFPYREKRHARIKGWERRFWQSSHDHRGTPEAPGRVVTLTEQPNTICDGMAYRVTPDTFAHLDHREKNGYLRFFTPLQFPNEPGHAAAQGLVYVAGPENDAFAGPAPLEAMVYQIANSNGPSGANAEYLLMLDEALNDLGVVDEHVAELAHAVRALL